VHDGAVVVRHTVQSVLLLELRQKPVVHVSPVKRDVIVPVASLLFVPHSQAVTDLMNRNSELLNSTTQPTVTAQAQRLCVAQWLAQLKLEPGDPGSNPGSRHYSTNLGQVVYSHCLPGFSAPRNWGTKREFSRRLCGYGD